MVYEIEMNQYLELMTIHRYSSYLNDIIISNREDIYKEEKRERKEENNVGIVYAKKKLTPLSNKH